MSEFEETMFGPAAASHVAELEGRTADLQAQLAEARERAARGFRQLDTFKNEVRIGIIEKVRDGTICRPGANEFMAEHGMETYTPRYRVDISIEVCVEVQAEDDDDARDLACRSLTVTGDSDVQELEVGEFYVRGSQEVGFDE